MLSDSSGNTVTFFFFFSCLFPSTMETQKYGQSVYLVYFVILKIGKKTAGDFAVKEVLLTTRPE